MTQLPVDDIDATIIRLLQENGRMPNTEIAGHLNLSETAIRKRLRRLLDDEVIQIIAVVNRQKLGVELEGNIKIKTDPRKNARVKRKLQELDGLWYIAHVAGAADFDVEFNANSQDELHNLIETINRIDGIRDAEVSIRLQLVKNRGDWEK